MLYSLFISYQWNTILKDADKEIVAICNICFTTGEKLSATSELLKHSIVLEEVWVDLVIRLLSLRKKIHFLTQLSYLMEMLICNIAFSSFCSFSDYLQGKLIDVKITRGKMWILKEDGSSFYDLYLTETYR